MGPAPFEVNSDKVGSAWASERSVVSLDAQRPGARSVNEVRGWAAEKLRVTVVSPLLQAGSMKQEGGPVPRGESLEPLV